MMTASGFALFETPAGTCALAWNGQGIAGVQLPERDVAATRRRMALRFPEAHEGPPPRHVRPAIRAITALLRGEPDDLSSVTLDLSDVQPFRRRVYEAARRVPPGSTVTYGEIASLIGSPGAARAVGQALGQNPFPLVVPCHRVLAAGGAMGGFSATGGLDTKRRLLAIEGVALGAALPARAGKARTGTRAGGS